MQTFIAGLRSHGLIVPWIVNAPMNQRIFETWVETQLAQTLSKGDIVILDNVAFHKREAAEKMVRAKVPGCSSCRPTAPTSILSRWPSQTQGAAAKARRFDAISTALGEIVSLCSVIECRNFFKAVGYEAQ